MPKASTDGAQTSDRNPLRPEALTNNQNDAERSLHYPMLKVEHAESRECQQAQKGEQLITPLHERDVEARLMIVKPEKVGKALSGLPIVGTVRNAGAGNPDDSRWLGN